MPSAPDQPLDAAVVARLESWARIAGILVTALGLAALAGWWLDVIVLRQLHPSLEPMKANAAVALSVIGGAIVLIARRPARVGAARALGATAAIIGTLTLVEHALQWNLGIDQLLVDDIDDPTAPGRMSIATAIDLVLASLAILTLDWRARLGRYLAECLALGAGFVSLLAFLGHLYGVRAFYTLGSYEALALNPAVGLSVVSFAVLAARPQHGIMGVLAADGPGGALARRLLPTAIILPAALGGLRQWGLAAGLFDAEYGTAVIAASSVVVFSALTWFTARALTGSDVARRSAEGAVRAREEDLATTLRSIGDAVIATDVDGCVTRMNPVAEALTGWQREDAEGKPLAEVFHIINEDTRKPADSPVVRVLREGVVVGLANHTALIARDGTERAIEDSAAPIRGDQNELRGVVMVFHDVSDKRGRERAEEALRHVENQLRQAQRIEAIGRLAGGVAHDFNNLLMVISSYSQLLGKQLPPDDPARLHVHEILRAVERAAELTRQLLAFGRQQVLSPSAVDLAQTLKRLASMLRRVIGEHIELIVESTGQGAAVFVDPGQLEQVIVNLVVNARDAMPQGGKLTLSTAGMLVDATMGRRLEISPGRYVSLAVTDTGVGMDASTRSRLFEPFFTTKAPGKGTGLGLATVFGIVTQSGGAIVVDSEPSEGTTFRIYLPYAPDDEIPTAEESPVIGERSRGGETVLLVEDDEQLLALLSSILGDAGYSVLQAKDGEAGLRVASEHTGEIHLLLTDVVMPRMGGRELAERLGKTRPESSILFMSGHTDDAILHHGVRTHEMAFVHKPVDPDVLLNRIRELLDAASQ